MTPQELRIIGERLYGEQWQTPLSKALPIKSTRTIRYWLSGTRPIRPVIAERIRQLRDGGKGATKQRKDHL